VRGSGDTASCGPEPQHVSRRVRAQPHDRACESGRGVKPVASGVVFVIIVIFVIFVIFVFVVVVVVDNRGAAASFVVVSA